MCNVASVDLLIRLEGNPKLRLLHGHSYLIRLDLHMQKTACMKVS